MAAEEGPPGPPARLDEHAAASRRAISVLAWSGVEFGLATAYSLFVVSAFVAGTGAMVMMVLCRATAQGLPPQVPVATLALVVPLGPVAYRAGTRAARDLAERILQEPQALAGSFLRDVVPWVRVGEGLKCLFTGQRSAPWPDARRVSRLLAKYTYRYMFRQVCLGLGLGAAAFLWAAVVGLGHIEPVTLLSALYAQLLLLAVWWLGARLAWPGEGRRLLQAALEVRRPDARDALRRLQGP